MIEYLPGNLCDRVYACVCVAGKEASQRVLCLIWCWNKSEKENNSAVLTLQNNSFAPVPSCGKGMLLACGACRK